MRHSDQREAILIELINRKDHPTADMIYADLRQKYPNISLGTVYRNLKSFVDEGKILSLETTDKSIHYDGDTSEHAHFLCESCGKIIDLFVQLPLPKEFDDLNVLVKKQKNFYYGLCQDCSAKLKK